MRSAGHLLDHLVRDMLFPATMGTVCAPRPVWPAAAVERGDIAAIRARTAEQAAVHDLAILVQQVGPLGHHLRHRRIRHSVSLLGKRRRRPGDDVGVLGEYSATIEGDFQHAREAEAKLQRRPETRHARHVGEVQLQHHARRRPAAPQNARAQRRAKRLHLGVALPRVPQPHDGQAVLLGAPVLRLPALEDAVGEGPRRVALQA
mmetsp:Transcript_163806/g.525351  ORF Transcript_163806/g.525351 Transcript_163806/m.525351 type:complete len:204 (-) Transcript_163806:2790-3401(-)